MNYLSNPSQALTLILGLLALLGLLSGGYFALRSGLSKVLQDEVQIYKEKVERLQEDFTALENKYKEVDGNKRYLENLVKEALTKDSSITKEVLSRIA